MIDFNSAAQGELNGAQLDLIVAGTASTTSEAANAAAVAARLLNATLDAGASEPSAPPATATASAVTAQQPQWSLANLLRGLRAF